MTTRRDRSTTTGIVVTCDECEYFHAFAWTRLEAEAAEIRHERLAHPRCFRVRKRESNRKYATRRRAENRGGE